MLTLGAFALATVCAILFAWLFIGTRAAFVALIGGTTVIAIELLLRPLPSETSIAILLVVGTVASITVGFLAIYVVGVLSFALTIRGLNALISSLLNPHDTDENPVSGRKKAFITTLVRLRKWVNRVSTNYFRPGAKIVGSNPRYFYWLQRRAYFHANPEDVNYHLQWLEDHFSYEDDDEAREHVKELQRELDADRIWSP